MSKLQEYQILFHNKEKGGFEDKKIVHMVQNKQRLEDMDVGMMIEILKTKVMKVGN